MDTPNKFRRETLAQVAGLQLEPKNLTLFVSKVTSLAILAAFGFGLWAAFCFARTTFAGAAESGAEPETIVPALAPSADGGGGGGANSTATAGVAPPTRREPLVYLAESDPVYFHACGHKASDGKRQAVPAGLARARGFAPCQVCFRTKS